MFLKVVCILLALNGFIDVTAQRILSLDESLRLALNNQQNIAGGQLTIRQQQELLGSARGLNNPNISIEVSPYEGPLVGIEQQFNLPAVGRSRKALQEQRIKLAQLQLQGSQVDLRRTLRLSYLQLQFYDSRIIQLRNQDSVYQSIKIASQRFFNAGQINKLEELTATTQADKVRNELNRSIAEYKSEIQILRFLTAYNDSIFVEPLKMAVFTSFPDTINSIQKQLLAQQVEISRTELAAERSNLLPSLTGGLLFPLANEYKRSVGFQAGVSIPIWGKQNRSRISAAKTGIEIAEADRNLAAQRIDALYRQALARLQRDSESISYYINIGLPQSRAIIDVSQRLFQGGEINYIESLRNLVNAFEIQNNYLETLRNYNEAVIELGYLKGE